jgi:hypothetical protein
MHLLPFPCSPGPHRVVLDSVPSYKHSEAQVGRTRYACVLWCVLKQARLHWPVSPVIPQGRFMILLVLNALPGQPVYIILVFAYQGCLRKDASIYIGVITGHQGHPGSIVPDSAPVFSQLAACMTACAGVQLLGLIVVPVMMSCSATSQPFPSSWLGCDAGVYTWSSETLEISVHEPSSSSLTNAERECSSACAYLLVDLPTSCNPSPARH